MSGRYLLVLRCTEILQPMSLMGQKLPRLQ